MFFLDISDVSELYFLTVKNIYTCLYPLTTAIYRSNNFELSINMDNNKLYKELQGELSRDKMYWLRNDAKLKAVVTSKSYDEFKQIVAAAHLQPLTKKELDKKQPPKWNKLS